MVPAPNKEESQVTLPSDAHAGPHGASVVLVTSLAGGSIHLYSDTTCDPRRGCQGRQGQACLKAFSVRAGGSEAEVRTWKPRHVRLTKASREEMQHDSPRFMSNRLAQAALPKQSINAWRESVVTRLSEQSAGHRRE